VASIAAELVKLKTDVVFYSTDEFQPLIKATGAKYKPYIGYPSDLFKQKTLKEKLKSLHNVTTELLTFSHKFVPELLVDAQREKPDLVILDGLSLHGKYLIRILTEKYGRDKQNNNEFASERQAYEMKKQLHKELNKPLKLPVFKVKNSISLTKAPYAIKIQADFATKSKVYPTESQQDALDAAYGKAGIFKQSALQSSQNKFNKKFNIDVEDPVSFMLNKGYEWMTLVTICPEVQPVRDKFDNFFRFLGCGLGEELRNSFDKIKDEEFYSLMKEFEPQNPIGSLKESKSNDQKLIYVYLGQYFDAKTVSVFETITNAIIQLELTLKTVPLKVVMSVGNAVFEVYKQKINKENYYLQNNFLVRARVPQLDVLKRASVFVTHAGVNSVCEAIHYGVPMICIPLEAKNALVASHVCDELDLGYLFKAENLSSNSLCGRMFDLITEEINLERAFQMASVSRKYKSATKGCGEIMNLLNYLESKKD
jgi:UDP:flavonoid glycosyltransferase YjiC (YdhE family)